MQNHLIQQQQQMFKVPVGGFNFVVNFKQDLV
jgi:hypothetical protein